MADSTPGSHQPARPAPDLTTIDVEAAFRRQLVADSRARFKADVPDAPDWALDLFAAALVASLL